MSRFGDPEPLAGHHVLEGFDCGREPLNTWLCRHARQAGSAGSARTYVVVDSAQRRVVGYHALTVAGLEHADAPERVVKGMPRYPVPVVLLARLAVDRSVSGRGVGAWLLRDAMLRALGAAEAVGVRAMVVHAQDDAARGFCLKHGLEPSPTDPLHLVILLKDIVASAEIQPAHLR